VSELWIRFDDGDFDAFDWWRFEPGNERPVSQGRGRGDDLASLEVAARCRVFIPQSLLLSLRAQLPPKASRQQLQAIGFAIEDRLANDVEDNHFATGSQHEDGTLPVVAVERSLMDRLMLRLRQARLRCDAIHPEMYLCPPPRPDALASLCDSPQGWVLRLSADEALTASRSLLADTLDWLAAGDAVNARLDCCADSSIDGAQHESFECRAVDCVPVLTRVKDDAVNLLQGVYRPGNRWRERLRPWKPVGWLLLFLLLLSAGLALVDRIDAQRRLDALRAEQWALIDRYLPGTDHKGDAKRLLVQRLSALGKGGSRQGPIDLLARFASLKGGFPDLQIRRLLYRDAELAIDLQATRLKTFEALEEQLKKQGLSYRIENLDIGPKQTRARLILGGRS